MHLDLRFFASLRETMRRDGDRVELPGDMSVSDALAWITARDPLLARTLSAMPRVRFAINRRFAGQDGILHDGDELAIFPPVTGG